MFNDNFQSDFLKFEINRHEPKSNFAAEHAIDFFFILLPLFDLNFRVIHLQESLLRDVLDSGTGIFRVGDHLLLLLLLMQFFNVLVEVLLRVLETLDLSLIIWVVVVSGNVVNFVVSTLQSLQLKIFEHYNSQNS